MPGGYLLPHSYGACSKVSALVRHRIEYFLEVEIDSIYWIRLPNAFAPVIQDFEQLNLSVAQSSRSKAVLVTSGWNSKQDTFHYFPLGL